MRQKLASIKDKGRYISMGNAITFLGVSIPSLRNYIHALDLPMFKFPLDIKTYLLREDVERIKQLRAAARDEVPA